MCQQCKDRQSRRTTLQPLDPNICSLRLYAVGLAAPVVVVASVAVAGPVSGPPIVASVRAVEPRG